MIKVFRQNNFEQPHEREAFRKICNMLNQHLNNNDEDYYIFANVDLPKSIFNSKFKGNKKGVNRQASPDLIIFKNNGVCVVELKSHAGIISWNSEDLYETNSWRVKLLNRQAQIINEDSMNPYRQIKYNRQAVIGFLQSNESKFCSKEHRGSDWHLTRSSILFTNERASFSENYNDLKDISSEFSKNWDFNIYISTLHKNAKSTFFPDFVKDAIVTPSRNYISNSKRDKLSNEELNELLITKIAFNEEEILKIAGLLKCNDVTKDYIGDFKVEEIEDLNIITGLGFAPTLVHDRSDDVKKLDSLPKPSEEILKLPSAIRKILYFKHSISDESKINDMSLYINSKNAHQSIFILKDLYDTIFTKNKPLKIADDIIQNIDLALKADDISLTYGLGLSITSKYMFKKELFCAEPLFSTSVKFESGSYIPVMQNELSINNSILRQLPGFKDLTDDEFYDKKDSIFQKNADSSEKIIRSIYEEIGLSNNVKNFDPFRIQNINTINPTKGFKPNSAAIYLSQSNFTKNLIRELDTIYIDWKSKHEKDIPIDDLAFKFLNNFTDLKQKNNMNTWNPPFLNILDSNYEQSKSVGLSTNNNVPISVVSGPPGTGKSQFSINTIAEMNFKEKSVLFSSKNNKAVDVVSDKMNKIAPLSINRYGNSLFDDEVEKFKYKPLNIDERQSLKSEISKNISLLNQLKDRIDLYEISVVDIDRVEDDISNILHANPGLDLINWYADDSSILNINFWESKLIQSKEVKNKGFFKRFIEVINSDDTFNFYDIINQESFISKNLSTIVNELKINLPRKVVEKIGENNLLEFSKNYLEILKKLDFLSKKLNSYINIINENKDHILYDEWSKIASKNTLNSLKIYNDKVQTEKRPFKNESVQALSIAKYIPLKPGIFDLTILDEASQTDVICAIPLLYRSKKALIIGDEKQLNPIINITDDKDIENWQSYGLKTEDYIVYGYKVNSLLSTTDKILNNYNLSRTILKEHFRCHPNIINFSNRFFYDNSLRIKTDSNNSVGIHLISHQEDCEKPANNRSWINPEEATIVVSKILELLKSYKPEDIGVVTPFKAQAEHIKNNLLNSEMLTEKDFLSLTIDTAHKFQGDEKEVIIYSLVAGSSMSDRAFSWMSGNDSTNPLEKNIINVAITRAKRELFIIGNEDFISSKSGLLTELINWTKFCNREEIS